MTGTNCTPGWVAITEVVDLDFVAQRSNADTERSRRLRAIPASCLERPVDRLLFELAKVEGVDRGEWGGIGDASRQQRIEIDVPASKEDRRPAHHVLKLTDVAPERQLGEACDRILSKQGRLGALISGEALEQRGSQQGNVRSSFAQRRNLELDHIESKEEVIAEATESDFLGEVFLTRGNQPEVDGLRNARAERSDFLLLQRAKQLRLEG